MQPMILNCIFMVFHPFDVLMCFVASFSMLWTNWPDCLIYSYNYVLRAGDANSMLRQFMIVHFVSGIFGNGDGKCFVMFWFGSQRFNWLFHNWFGLISVLSARVSELEQQLVVICFPCNALAVEQGKWNRCELIKSVGLPRVLLNETEFLTRLERIY